MQRGTLPSQLLPCRFFLALHIICREFYHSFCLYRLSLCSDSHRSAARGRPAVTLRGQSLGQTLQL